MHFMGLVSDGGVHSSLEHLFKLCDISAAYGLENTFVHCFMDGRDTDPHSGKGSSPTSKSTSQPRRARSPR